MSGIGISHSPKSSVQFAISNLSFLILGKSIPTDNEELKLRFGDYDMFLFVYAGLSPFLSSAFHCKLYGIDKRA